MDRRIITKWKMNEIKETLFPIDELDQNYSKVKCLSSHQIEYDSFSGEEDDDTFTEMSFDMISNGVKVRDESRKGKGETNLSIMIPSFIIYSLIFNLQKIFIKFVKKDQTFLQIFWMSFLLTFANAIMLIHF